MDSSSAAKGLLFGGIASSLAEVVTLPVDVLKTRLQLQGQMGAAAEYKGSIDAVVQIVRTEGVGALWKGLSPAVLRQMTYGSMRYGLYTPIKKALGVKEGTPKHEIPMGTRILAGGMSGALASALANPLDLTKVRLQADKSEPGATPRYRGLTHAFTTIVKEEGVLGLWKGVGPTCGRATVLAAAELATYDEVKHQLLHREIFAEGLPLHAATASVAGFVAAFCSSPFDVVKSRVMNQPFDPVTRKGTQYSGMIDCFKKSVNKEGVFSLWRGFVPNFARVGPRVVIIFIVLEQLRKVFDS